MSAAWMEETHGWETLRLLSECHPSWPSRSQGSGSEEIKSQSLCMAFLIYWCSLQLGPSYWCFHQHYGSAWALFWSQVFPGFFSSCQRNKSVFKHYVNMSNNTASSDDRSRHSYHPYHSNHALQTLVIESASTCHSHLQFVLPKILLFMLLFFMLLCLS